MRLNIGGDQVQIVRTNPAPGLTCDQCGDRNVWLAETIAGVVYAICNPCCSAMIFSDRPLTDEQIAPAQPGAPAIARVDPEYVASMQPTEDEVTIEP